MKLLLFESIMETHFFLKFKPQLTATDFVANSLAEVLFTRLHSGFTTVSLLLHAAVFCRSFTIIEAGRHLCPLPAHLV